MSNIKHHQDKRDRVEYLLQELYKDEYNLEIILDKILEDDEFKAVLWEIVSADGPYLSDNLRLLGHNFASFFHDRAGKIFERVAEDQADDIDWYLLQK